MKRVIAEYVWVDGSGSQTRSKTKTVLAEQITLAAFPEWNYDGSSCAQATAQQSEIVLQPVAYFNDPFRQSNTACCDAFIVLCQTQSAYGGEMTERGSQRQVAQTVFDNETVSSARCWFGLEQEYVVLDEKSGRPLGWPSAHNSFPAAQGRYYCAPSAPGRAIAEEHYLACLAAGLTISGYNMEVMPGQLEFQIGPCSGLQAGDELVVARYILDRVCAEHGCVVSLHPKPEKGDWNGSGMHTNFSTSVMRGSSDDDTERSWAAIQSAIEKLEASHSAHMAVYGEHNEERMSGKHETSAMNQFTHGIGDRTASVRIGKNVEKQRFGYIEDRRPAANANPYLVVAKIAETVLLSRKAVSSSSGTKKRATPSQWRK